MRRVSQLETIYVGAVSGQVMNTSPDLTLKGGSYRRLSRICFISNSEIIHVESPSLGLRFRRLGLLHRIMVQDSSGVIPKP